MAKKTDFNALFQNVQQSPGAFAGVAAVVDQVTPKTKRRYGVVLLDHLRPNPHQPRKHFDQSELEELGDSILEHGLLEPLVVRESASDTGYFDIACGERRWKAMLLKDITEADAVILEKDCSDYAMEQIALAENIQRVDLSPFELALAYDRLRKDEQGLVIRTFEEVAHLAKKPPSTIDDHLAILRVPEDVRQLIIENPQIPLRIIRDLGNVENSDDRAFLAQEVRTGSLSSNAITRIISQVKKQQQPKSAYAEKKKGNSQEYPVPREILPTTMPVPETEAASPPAQRHVSPAVALATLEQKLLKDTGQIRKITERLAEDLKGMGNEEKKRLEDNVRQWHTWMQRLLDLAIEEG
jgi:ParB family transcriptional regulator, chromosome partitioning protein